MGNGTLFAETGHISVKREIISKDKRIRIENVSVGYFNRNYLHFHSINIRIISMIESKDSPDRDYDIKRKTENKGDKQYGSN